MILKCVARCRCSGEVAQEKVDCLYISQSVTSVRQSRTSNKYTV